MENLSEMTTQQLHEKLNMYRKILAVQELYQKYQDGGRTAMWIWKNHVYPTYFIAYRTMRRYLGEPAKKLVKELELHIQKKEQCEQ